MAWNDLTNPEAWKLALANLLRKGEDVGTYISEAPEKAGKAIVEAGQRQSALMDKAFDPTGKTLIRDPQAANQAAMNLLEGPLGFMPAGITAWHGSPHTFEAFDVTKGGTGQGTQNYGHGTYFAENPTIAEGYMGRTVIQEPKLEKFTFNGPDYTIVNGQYLKSGKPISEEEYKKAFSGINQLWNTQNKGSLYKVDIPDELIPKMLDWYEQVPESVKKEISDKAMKKWGSGVSDTSGEKLYKEIVFNFKQQGSKTPQADASKWLAEQGIPGIKYENFQIKKGQGANTSNYVVFNPTDVKILERNNQPMTRKEVIEEQVNKLK